MRTIGCAGVSSNPRLADRLCDLFLIVGGSLFVALCAKIQVWTLPVPITLQTVAVVLVGAALGPRRGCAAMIAYLIEGAGGLPVFAGPVAGPAYFAGPTAGYLLSFPVAAYVVGLLARGGWDRGILRRISAFVIGHAVILLIGFGWLATHIGVVDGFRLGIAPFVALALLKSTAAALALPAVRRGLGTVEPRRR